MSYNIKPLEKSEWSNKYMVYWTVKLPLYDNEYRWNLYNEGEVTQQYGDQQVPIGNAKTLDEAEKLVQEHYQKAVNEWLSVYLLTETV